MTLLIEERTGKHYYYYFFKCKRSNASLFYSYDDRKGLPDVAKLGKIHDELPSSVHASLNVKIGPLAAKQPARFEDLFFSSLVPSTWLFKSFLKCYLLQLCCLQKRMLVAALTWTYVTLLEMQTLCCAAQCCQGEERLGSQCVLP